MDILKLIDDLEELTVQARRLPVGGNLVMDRKRVLDLIDQLRLAVPADIRQATQILEARDELVREAHIRSDELLRNAEEERQRRLNETSIMREAQERSQALLVDADTRARQTVAEAEASAAAHLNEVAEAVSRQLDDTDHYALEVLSRLESQLNAFLEAVRVSIASVQEKR